MWAGWKSEFAYVKGFVRGLSGTNVVMQNPGKTIGDYLEEWGRRHGDRLALKSERESLTFRELDARANAYARWALDEGLKEGDVVALMMPNRPEYMAVWFGLTRIGIEVALVNTHISGAVLTHAFKAVDAKAAIIDASLAPAFASARENLDQRIAVWFHGEAGTGEPRVDLAVATLSGAPLESAERPALTIENTALYMYTSGTTGLPKAARVTHSRILRMFLAFGRVLAVTSEDCVYISLPMYHTNGGLLAPALTLAAGGSCYIRERFSASAFWSDVIREQCTLFIYIGEVCRYLINAPASPNDRAHKLRAGFGNGLRADIFTAFQQRFGIAEIYEFYAATEGNAVLLNLDSRAGAIGRVPFWARRRFPVKVVAFDHDANLDKRDARGRCIECRPGEPGELIAEIRNDPKTPAATFDGYTDPIATQQKVIRDVFKPGDAWFRTGDIVRRDAHGYFYFVDRVGDTFRWKGENVSTTEVAEILAGFPGVQAAVVYGVAAPRHDGRAGMAALVVESIADFDLKGLRAFMAERLPIYARPIFVRFRTELEVTATFKLRKLDLVAEGFDPRRVSDPVFFDDRTTDAYVQVGESLVAALETGEMRL